MKKCVIFFGRYGMNKVEHMTEVVVQVGEVQLDGNLLVPGLAKGLVVFVHGSGSSRFSPRNQYVARVLNEGGLATLLFDLLTADENEIDMLNRELRFDISLLSKLRSLRGPHTYSGNPASLNRLPPGSATGFWNNLMSEDKLNLFALNRSHDFGQKVAASISAMVCPKPGPANASNHLPVD
jgi:hypothetical protein